MITTLGYPSPTSSLEHEEIRNIDSKVVEISLLLPINQVEQLEMLAEEQGVTTAQLIRKFIRQSLESSF